MIKLYSLFRFAKLLAYKYAEIGTSAQSYDVEKVLGDAGLLNASDKVSPILGQAGVPETTSVDLRLIVKPDFSIDYIVILDPVNPAVAKKLSFLLKKSFGPAMSKALKDRHLIVAGDLEVKWLKF